MLKEDARIFKIYCKWHKSKALTYFFDRWKYDHLKFDMSLPKNYVNRTRKDISKGYLSYMNENSQNQVWSSICETKVFVIHRIITRHLRLDLAELMIRLFLWAVNIFKILGTQVKCNIDETYEVILIFMIVFFKLWKYLKNVHIAW